MLKMQKKISMVMKLTVIILELNIQYQIKSIIQHLAFIWAARIVTHIEVVVMTIVMIMVDADHQDAILQDQDLVQDHMIVSLFIKFFIENLLK